MEKAEFYFDPVCPWAWMTSRWMLEVMQVRDVRVEFHVMSLSVLNEGRDVPEDYKRHMQESWGPVRTIIKAREVHGQDIVLPLYSAIGKRIHLEKRGFTKENPDQLRASVIEALAEVGASAECISVWATTEVDDLLRESHNRGMLPVGTDVGTPVIHVAGTAFFGPVISPAPKGEAAGKLWDGVLLVSQTPGFFELKRSRTVGPIFD
jgi:hypothetical protein